MAQSARDSQYLDKPDNGNMFAPVASEKMPTKLPVFVHQHSGAFHEKQNVYVPHGESNPDQYVQSEMSRLYGPAAGPVDGKTGVMHLNPILPNGALPAQGKGK